MEQDVWNGYLLQAAQCLSRACERLAEEVGSGETGVKAIRELTAALKELTALQKSLQGEQKTEDSVVEVCFPPESESWSK